MHLGCVRLDATHVVNCRGFEFTEQRTNLHSREMDTLCVAQANRKHVLLQQIARAARWNRQICGKNLHSGEIKYKTYPHRERAEHI